MNFVLKGVNNGGNNMKRDNAEKIMKIMNRIRRCESFLESLKDRSYPDEFAIQYRGYETCELEPDILKMIIAHYETELKSLNNELSKI